MAQKKLLIFMPSIEGGGVEKNFFIISNFLSNKIDNVSVITISNTYKNNLSKKLNFISMKSKIWEKFGRRFKFLLSLYLLMKKILTDRNVIVLCFQGNAYCILMCKIFGIKVIVRSNSSPSGWSKNLVKRIIYRIGLNLANTVIVNSIEFKNEMKKKFSINAYHIYNPLDQKLILDLSKKKVKNFFPKNTLKIINVGRLVDQKNQLNLLKAINEIKNFYNIKLILIGRGVDLQKIKEFIKINKMSKLVKILYTSNPMPYIKQADLFILSSKFEGLPNVLLESITLKKMIISSNCPTGPKEILSNGKGGLLFKVGDYKELSKKIIFFIKNKNKCKKMTNFSFNQLSRFDYEKNLNRYFNVVKKII